MKKAPMLAMLVLILAVGALPAAAITGGTLDGDAHPNVGMLVTEIDGVQTRFCSGTLIAPRVFLTAGHCVEEGVTAARVWFETDLGDNPDFPAGGPSAHEGTPVPHPLYVWSGSDRHDVGVVILDEPVTHIAPATLATPDLLGQLKEDGILRGGYEEGVYFRSVGYGLALFDWPPPIPSLDLTRRCSESQYVALTQVHLHLSQRAVFDESGSCSGDSGGPVFWVDPNGNEILVAVVSTGDLPCVAIALDYRVDIPDIRQWIEDQIEWSEEQ
jgi:hypothetical protein